MDIPQFTHSPVEVYLGSLQVMVILNEAAVNTCIQCVCISLGEMPRGGIAGRMVGAVWVVVFLFP